MFKTVENRLNGGLLVLRLGVGIIFVFHGMQKWQLWGEAGEGSMAIIMKVLSIVEPLAGLALILGVFTSISAAALALVMLGAIYFKIQIFKIGFVGMKATGWEFDLVLLSGLITLALIGGGAYALDKMMPKKKIPSAAPASPQSIVE